MSHHQKHEEQDDHEKKGLMKATTKRSETTAGEKLTNRIVPVNSAPAGFDAR
jgi:hypothetical protein